MKILITGITGQVGSYIRRTLVEHELILSDRKMCDFTSNDSIKKFIDYHCPDLIINPAAYTNVELADTDIDLAYKINSEAVLTIAKKANEHNIPVIHFSTDYVFDGKKDSYDEKDIPNPLNIYGKSKLKGEENLANNCNKYAILRTSWVYSEIGKNFLLTIYNLAKTSKKLKIVNDQFGTPTSAWFIAQQINDLINHNIQLQNEIYHLVPDGSCSWYDFATSFLIYLLPKIDLSLINPVSTDQYQTKVLRPKKTILNNDKVKKCFNINFHSWEDEFLKYKGYLDVNKIKL